jgi:hypothetical protein
MTSQERANRIADIVLECNRLAKLVDRLATYCPLCGGPCGHLLAAHPATHSGRIEAQEHSGPGGCVNSLSPGTSPTTGESG